MVLLAEALVGNVIKSEGENDAPVVKERFAGKDLEYKEYEPLFGFTGEFVAKNRSEKAFYVTCDGYVTMTDGTGIVHIAPAFGEDDARVGRRYDAPFVQMVDEHGRLKPETGKFAGMRCKPTQHEMDGGAVSVNHLPEEHTDRLLREGDMLSVRGFGRVRLTGVGEPTRKDRLPVTLEVFSGRG